ncbi:hypothetical protein PN836_002915 [Ningiella sp. W23]|uniref:hypothetical protein n=1 Tax=Ningiella sp. W23 TaxID=3023715 RepID=UPI003757FB47
MIFVLLAAQVGNAFAADPENQGCSMNMSDAAMMEHSHMQSNHASSDVFPMDCCDGTASVSCCNGDCECSVASASSIFVYSPIAQDQTLLSDKLLVYTMQDVAPPFIAQTKRPPIA